jgi:hypothetical protein
MPDKKITRDVADAARERAAKSGEPTARDRLLAEQWFPLIRSGQLTQHDLAALLTSVRFDVELVRRLELDVSNALHGVRATSRRVTRNGK